MGEKQHKEKLFEKSVDFETHYNLGLAYKDMEMFEDAIKELEIAIRANPKEYSNKEYFICCKNLGLSFARLGMIKQAIVWYKRALNVPDQLEQEYFFVKQELSLVKRILKNYSNSANDDEDSFYIC